MNRFLYLIVFASKSNDINEKHQVNKYSVFMLCTAGIAIEKINVRNMNTNIITFIFFILFSYIENSFFNFCFFLFQYPLNNDSDNY